MNIKIEPAGNGPIFQVLSTESSKVDQNRRRSVSL